MSKTYRNVPTKKWTRHPKYKHKILAGESPKWMTTDWDDKQIMARKEVFSRDDRNES